MERTIFEVEIPFLSRGLDNIFIQEKYYLESYLHPVLLHYVISCHILTQYLSKKKKMNPVLLCVSHVIKGCKRTKHVSNINTFKFNSLCLKTVRLFVKNFENIIYIRLLRILLNRSRTVCNYKKIF